jgi:hypothetical protein
VKRANKIHRSAAQVVISTKHISNKIYQLNKSEDDDLKEMKETAISGGPDGSPFIKD